MNLILQRLYDEPWAITGAALEVIIGVADREIDLVARMQNGEALDKLFHTGALMAKPGTKLEGTQRTEMRDGVAVIPVYGPIFPRANMFTQVSGATSAEMLAQDFTAALNNPDVRGILFSIDSPGGAINGIGELSDLIYNARKQKPIMSHISGIGASAALWLASATSKVMASQTAEVGSVGVVAAYRDTKGADEKAGVKNVEVVSSVSPLKRVDMMSDEGRSKMQRVVDAVATVFVKHLARNRGVEEAKVLTDFGRGDIFIGERAVQAGMADEVATFEQALMSIQAECGYKKKPKRKELHMAEGEQVTMTAEAVRESQPEAANALVSQGKAEGIKAGAEAERARIQSIMALNLKGFDELVTAAIADGNVTAEKLALQVVQKQQAQGAQAGAQVRTDAQALAAAAAGAGSGMPSPSAAANEDAERKHQAEVMAKAANGKRSVKEQQRTQAS